MPSSLAAKSHPCNKAEEDVKRISEAVPAGAAAGNRYPDMAGYIAEGAATPHLRFVRPD
jgi:hypothetical protein